MKPYLIELSNGRTIQIDESELPAVLKAKETNRTLILKRGIIFNPNHIIDLIVDRARIYDNRTLGKEVRELSDDFTELRNNIKRLNDPQNNK